MIAAAQVEMHILEARLARIGQPEGVKAGIWVLVGFAAVGIVFPLTMLAMRPVPSWWGARVMVIGAFTAGLAAVIVFMFGMIDELNAE